MAAFGDVVLVGGTSVSSLTTGNLNVTGTDLCLVIGASEDSGAIRTLTLRWDPAGNDEAPTGTFASLTDIGGYLDATFQYWDDPTAANAPVEVTFSGDADGAGLGGIFFTAAADVVGTDVASDSATSGTSLSATVPNVVSGDMVVDFLCFDPNGAGTSTAGANQTDRGTAAGDNYMSTSMSTQAGADGGVMSWTIPTVRYSAGLMAGRIPDAGGGGGAHRPIPHRLSTPNFLHFLGR